LSTTARAWAVAASGAAPLLRVMLRRRAATGKEFAARLPERYGIDPTPRPAGRLLWLHGASVGEALSVLPVLEALPADIFTLFTTGTVTSARLLAQRLPAAGLDARVLHRFVPLDVPGWVARFLGHWRPDLAAFVESEIWPNTLAECRARDIPTVLLNARMSVRSAARWCHVPAFAAELIGGFAWIEAQSDADARRLVSLGGRDVEALGNLKFAAADLPVDAAELSRLRGVLGDRPRWLAASTHPGDEEAVAAVHRGLAGSHPGLLTAIVPRHPERGAAIAAMLGNAPRRALGQDPGEGIWIADTLGEVGLLCRLFPIVFMGKSFGSGGGQNPLEPARLGCAVATGPATANFADAVAALGAGGGLAVVADPVSLASWVDAMLRDPAGRAAMGAAAQAVASAQAELPGRIAARLTRMIEGRPGAL
jgi:3-deoxy-D-manno-octulosonic-acid transferase